MWLMKAESIEGRQIEQVCLKIHAQDKNAGFVKLFKVIGN